MSHTADEDAVEGAIARNLFRTDDESSDEEEDTILERSQDINQETCDAFVQSPIMDILLEEQRIGGSIAQRLWPASEYLARFIMDQNSVPPVIVELGAGVGLTGLQLATQFECRVLLTDLPEAMPLLTRNIELNRNRFLLGETAVEAQVLSWGNERDAQATLAWIGDGPFLIIASDCVYFQELHEPLERTLCHLLKDRTGECWIAGMRRWKSDNAFYKNIGQKTKTPAQQLVCECLKETVSRNEENQREIIRVFSIEWKERQKKRQTSTNQS
jgi:hypothetical protein